MVRQLSLLSIIHTFSFRCIIVSLIGYVACISSPHILAQKVKDRGLIFVDSTSCNTKITFVFLVFDISVLT